MYEKGASRLLTILNLTYSYRTFSLHHAKILFPHLATNNHQIPGTSHGPSWLSAQDWRSERVRLWVIAHSGGRVRAVKMLTLC